MNADAELAEVAGEPAPAAPPTEAGLRAFCERLWRSVRDLESRVNRQAAKINELEARVAELE